MLIIAAAHFIVNSRESREAPPLAAEMFEDFLGCPSPSIAASSLEPFITGAARKNKVRSATLSAARRRVRALKKTPRIQIVNGSLYVSCPSGDGCISIAHELRTLQLLTRVSRVGDADFFFDGGERPCYLNKKRTFGQRQTRVIAHGRRTALSTAAESSSPSEWPPFGGSITHVVGAHVPVVTRETADGCDNLLGPPRALEALPDGGRWLARTEGDDVVAWSTNRRNVVVWRGAATSRGALFNADGTPRSTRAVALALSERRPDLFDARFAGRNDDLQLKAAERDEVRRRHWGADGTGFLTWRGLQNFRAMLVLDGNTLPDRLPFAMFSMTAVLKQESPLREAWYSELRPYVHYIPVRHDLSDLEAQLAWALANATRLHAIARNGARLAMRWLTRRAQICHWSTLLRGLSSVTARPVSLEKHARRVDGGGNALLGGAVLHNAFSSALRPQLTGRPLKLADLEAIRNVRLAPCVELTHSHLCVDL